MHKVLIIEDEVTARNHLLKLLKKTEMDFEVLATLSTVEQSVAWLKTNAEPDLIFMDIHLSDGISFDILAEVNVECPIIYITAYDQYAIKAFKTTGIDYLLKPVSEEDLQEALQKFSKLLQKPGEEWLLKNLEALQLIQGAQKQEYRERFLLKTGTQLAPVMTKDIAWFHRKDELVFAHTFNNESFLVDFSLNFLQKEVDPRQFFRLNRQLLVNLGAIHRLAAYKPGQTTVMLHPPYGEDLHLSQERSGRLKAVLGERS